MILLLAHRRIRASLFPLADGALAPERAQRVRAHVARCASCRDELARIELGIRLAAQLHTEPVPSAVWARVAARVRVQAPAVAPRRYVRRLTFVAGAIAAVAIGAVTWWDLAVRNAATGPWALTTRAADAMHRAGAPTSSSVASMGALRAGEWLDLSGDSVALLTIGTIGVAEVAPGTRLRILTARRRDQVLEIARGSVDVVISADPGVFRVRTPATLAVDLGCAYRLWVDSAGTTGVRVTTGWVALVGARRTVVLPEGAQASVRSGAEPSLPLFSDAPSGVQDAAGRLAADPSNADALRALVAESRPRDALTLWEALNRVPVSLRGIVVDKLATFAPIPAAASRDAAMALDASALLYWHAELEALWIPPGKVRMTKKAIIALRRVADDPAR
jgi:hypothetical protein